MSENFPPGTPNRSGPSGRDRTAGPSGAAEQHTPPGQGWVPGRHSATRQRQPEPPPRRTRPRHRRGPTRRTRLTITSLCTAAIVGGAVALAVIPGGTPARRPAPRGGSSAPTSPSTPAVAAGSSTSSTSSTLAQRRSTTTTSGAGSSSTPASSASTTTAVTTTTVTPVPATLPPSQVLVEVLNGTGQTGAATAASHALAAQGFLINGTGNAANFQYSETVVEYPPGALAAAQTVAAHVTGAATLEASSALPSGVVDLIIGATYNGVTNG
ncbi:MAG TPA: LytR C-terminal domain-containing protein [Acidimicrobiales bacterium]|nr:LytR C-terminal domain-containing protein [Acidimicrobiales bacterium]